MAANFHNTDLIDFIVDGTGQTQKSNTKALSEFINGTMNGAILTPYNVDMDGSINSSISALLTGETLFIGDAEIQANNQAVSPGRTLGIVSDTPRLVVVKASTLKSLYSITTGFVGYTLARGLVFEINSAIIGTGSVGGAPSVRLLDSVCYEELIIPFVGSTNKADKILGNTFIESSFYIGGQLEENTSIEINNNVFDSFTLDLSRGGSLVFNVAFEPLSCSGNYVRTQFYFYVGNASANELFYESISYFENYLFHPSSTFRVHIVTGGVAVDNTYTSLADLKAVYPTWFPYSAVGDIGYLGDDTIGEFLIAKDSDIYTKITGFESQVIRPGKASWIINSSTTGISFFDAVFVDDKLTASLSVGYLECEIYLQDSGLENPILWMSRGLDMLSNLPSCNVSDDPENPVKITFEADYKVVGGSYTESYYPFTWNEPIGFDGDGTSSGEASYNPLTLVPLNIQSIKISISVQQLADTSGTGIYGGYIAPQKENFCIKVLGNDTPLVGATVVIDGTEYITDYDGMTDIVYQETGVSFNYSATKLGFSEVSESTTLSYDYTVKTISLTAPLSVSRNYANKFSFLRFRSVFGANKSDLPVSDLTPIEL